LFDISTDVHFDSHMSVQLPIVDTFVLGVTSLNPLASVEISLEFVNFFAIRHFIVGPEFC